MQVRTLTPGEVLKARQIQTIAFVGELSEQERERLAAAPTEEGHERLWGFFSDAQELTAVMDVHDFSILADEKPVQMAGIGGVASLPEARGQGAVRAIFNALLPHLMQKGVEYSVLYPFSYLYYRKFGYELCYERRHIEIPTAAFQGISSKGVLRQWFWGDSAEGIQSVYRRFVEKTNQPVLRSEKAWERLLKHDPYTQRRYIYTWSDDTGAIKGYIFLRAEKKESGTALMCPEMAYTEPAALWGLLSLVHSLSAQYATFCGQFPAWFPALGASIPSPYEGKDEIRYAAMTRIVDLGAAVCAMRAPEGKGTLCIDLKDPILPQNSGAFTIAWEDGKVSLTPGGAPALSLGIGRLTQLALGYVDYESARHLYPDMKELGDCSAAHRLFVKKPQTLLDFF